MKNKTEATRKPAYQRGRDLALDKIASVDTLIDEGELSLSGAINKIVSFGYINLAGLALVWEAEEYAQAYHQTLREHEAMLRSFVA